MYHPAGCRCPPYDIVEPRGGLGDVLVVGRIIPWLQFIAQEYVHCVAAIRHGRNVKATVQGQVKAVLGQNDGNVRERSNT